MKKIINLKYLLISLLASGVISYLFSAALGLSFLITFIFVLLAMFANGIVAEFEDNLPGGFNNLMTSEEIKAEYIRRKKKYFPIRISIWVIFISLIIWMVWMYVNKNV